MSLLSNLSVSPIDLGIVGLYLLASLILGMRAGRKTQTMRDYAVASQSYDTPVIVCTLFATMVGASATMGEVEKIYNFGLIWAIYGLLCSLKTLMVSEWIAPRIQPFLGMLSVGDAMGSLYGPMGKVVTGIATVIISLGALGGQITALGYIFQHYLGIEPLLGSMIGWGVLLLYAARGGVRSVTVTDVLQFIILMVGIPFLCLFALYAVGGPIELYWKLPSTHDTLHLDGEGLNKYWTLWAVALLPTLPPAMFQRFLMVQSPGQLRDVLRAKLVVDLPFTIVLILLALAAVVLYPNMNAQFVLPTLIQDLLPIGMKGFVIAGLLAVIMSTGDSMLNTASVGLIHDVFWFVRPKKMDDTMELRLSRIATVVLGILGLFIGIQCTDIKALHFAALHCWGPVIVVPLLAGIFGLRTQASTFLLAAFGGLGMAFVWRFRIQPATGIDSLLPAIAANALTFYATHCILNPGTLKRWALSLWDRVRWHPGYYPHGYYPTPLKERMELLVSGINNFCKEKTDTHGIPYALFGLFVGVAYLGPYIMWSGTELNDSTVFMVLRFTACVLCVVLALQASWPKKLQAYIHIYWYFTLWFCLPTVSTYMLLAGDGGLFWWINLALSFIALLAVLDYVSFIFLSSMGVVAAMGLAKWLCIHFNPTLNPEGVYLVGYFYFFAAFGALLFIRSKEYIERRRQHGLRSLSTSVASRIKTAMGDVQCDYNTVRDLIKDIKAGKQTLEGALDTLEKVQERFSEVYYASNRTLKIVSDHVYAESHLDDPSLWPNFEIKPHLFSTLLERTMQIYCFSKQEMACVKFRLPYNAYVRADDELLIAVIGNLIQNALTSVKVSGKPNAEVIVLLEPCMWSPRLIIRDTGTGIDPKYLANIFHQYDPVTHTNTALGLAFCRKAMKKMMGRIEIFSKLGEFTEVVLTFKAMRPFEATAWKTPETAAGYEQLKKDSNGKLYWAKPTEAPKE